MERGNDVAIHQRRREVREHFWAILREHRQPGSLRHSNRLKNLNHLASAFADFSVTGNSAGQKDARLILVALQALNNEVWQQRTVK